MTRENPRRIFLLTAMLAVIGYGALLFDHIGRGVGGSDSAGYACAARDVLARRIVVPIEILGRLGLEDRYGPLFTPLAHEPGPRPGTMVPFYPPGYPLHMAFASLVAGWSAGPYVLNPLLAILAVTATFLVARELGVSRPLSFAAAAMFGGWAITLAGAVHPMSDLAATAWCTLAVLCALRARKSAAWAAGAGAAFGMAVLVRPTSAVLLAALAFALPWRPRVLAYFAAGGAPFAAFLGAWNRIAYGSPFTSGYSHLFASEFRVSNFGPRLRQYGGWILAQFSPLILLGWPGVAADRRVPARDRAMLLAWFAPILAFYCFWGPSDSWTYARFLLPGAPALAIGLVLVLRDLVRLLPEREPGSTRRTLAYSTAALVVAIGLVLVFERRAERRLRPLSSARAQAVFPDACAELARRAPDGKALVVSMEFSAALRFYTELTPVRWDRLGPGDFERLRARAAEKGYRVFALVYRHEAEPAAAAAPGAWKFLGDVAQASLWELPPSP